MRSEAGLAPGPAHAEALPLRRSNAARRWLVASLGTLAVIACGLFAGITIADREATLEQGWAEVESAALVLASQGERALRIGELVTERVADRIRERGLDHVRGEGWHELARMAGPAPEIGSLTVIGPDGMVVADSLTRDAPQRSLAEEPFFAALRDGQAFALGSLQPGPARGPWIASYNRAVHRDGKFLGIVQAAIRAEEMARLLVGRVLPAGAEAALVRPDGAPVMRWPFPAPDAAARSLPSQPPTPGRGLAHMPDGSPKLMAWRPIPSGALTAVIWLPQAQVMQPFQERLARNGLLFAISAAVAAAFAAAGLSAAAREARARRALETRQADLSAALAEREVLLASVGEAEARLRLAQQAGGIGLWYWDLRSDRLVLEGGVFRDWGITRRWFRPSRRGFRRGIHPEDWEGLSAAAVTALRGEGPLEAEFRLLGRGGERWIAVRAEVLRGAAGVPRRILGIALDITARRREADSLAEANATLERRVATRTRALAEANARLLESEARFRGIFNATFQLIALLSPDGTVLEANDAMLRLAAPGGERDGVVGRALWDAPWWPQDAAGRAALGGAIQRAGQGEFIRREMELRDHAGRSFAVDFSVTPVRDEEGLVSLLVAEARDISALKTAQAQLLEAQKLDTLGHLTGGVAHDFNNLLMVVLGNLRMARKRLEAGDGDPRRVLRQIDAALQGAERGATLTQRLLAFARRQDLKPRSVDLAALLQGMAELLGRSCGPLVRLRLEAAAGLPPALVDPHQLELALLNLAVNARDAMPEGGELRISVAEGEGEPPPPLPPGRYLRIAVADTGQGMDAATLARAVEPFFSTKGVGRGTGLGLSMVHGLALQSGGALLLDSEPGRGTVATLWLPVAPLPATAEARVEEEVPAARRGARILVVDDERLVLESTTSLLEDLGYEVIGADCGETALEVLAGQPEMDAVLTDYAMAGMTGVVLAERVRTLRPGLPVILATGYAEAGATEVSGLPRLMKPYTQAELAQALNAAMAARQGQAAG